MKKLIALVAFVIVLGATACIPVTFSQGSNVSAPTAYTYPPGDTHFYDWNFVGTNVDLINDLKAKTGATWLTATICFPDLPGNLQRLYISAVNFGANPQTYTHDVSGSAGCTAPIPLWTDWNGIVNWPPVAGMGAGETFTVTLAHNGVQEPEFTHAVCSIVASGAPGSQPWYRWGDPPC